MTATYSVSDEFFRRLFIEEQGVEPLLVIDQHAGGPPKRILLVRYVLGEGGGGESERSIFKDELSGYDYELKRAYPTQRVRLEALQSTLEPSMYGSSEAETVRTLVQNESTQEQRPIKALISGKLASDLASLYRFVL